MRDRDFTDDKFRAELIKVMPGYKWTVHKHVRTPDVFSATGTQSAGSNRLSTLYVERRHTLDWPVYEVKSSGYGTKAPWLGSAVGQTLKQALRELQKHYEHLAQLHGAHAADLQRGREDHA